MAVSSYFYSDSRIADSDMLMREKFKRERRSGQSTICKMGSKVDAGSADTGSTQLLFFWFYNLLIYRTLA